MITFFRKIRERLLNSGAGRKYVLYAIGEILLVMVGILLALQVNNWNERKKDKAREVKILQEISNSIDGDLKLYEDAFDWRMENKSEALDSMLAYIARRKPIPEDTFRVWYHALSVEPVLRFDEGPFEALKSTGLEIIQNDSLRTMINNTFQAYLPAQVMFSKMRVDRAEDRIAELETILMERRLVKKSDSEELVLRLYPKYNDMYARQEFLELVDLELEKWIAKDLRLRVIRRRMNTVKEMITNELRN